MRHEIEYIEKIAEILAKNELTELILEEGQQKIVSIIRRLEDSGEIVIARSGEDELVV